MVHLPIPAHYVATHTEVEQTIRRLHKQFDLAVITYDPWQCEHLSQRLTKDRLPMEETPQTGKFLNEAASRVIESFTDRRLDFYNEDNLKCDLLKLRVEERNYGYRLVSPRDEYGSGDLASAFSMALHKAHEQAGTDLVIVGAIF